jgi:type IV pilus assembly protein PilW
MEWCVMGMTILAAFMPTQNTKGVTLLELVIYVALMGIAFSGIWSAFNTQHAIHQTQKQIAAMQQNIRAAMHVLSKEIRMAGFDPDPTDDQEFQITDIRSRNDNNVLTVNGNSAFGFTAADYDNSGTDKTIFYSKNGPTTLARSINGSGRQLFAENIQSFELAYAFDNDGDGEMDLSAGGNIVWAVDSDNDNFLDMALDVNDDGRIDETDDTDSDGRINGTMLNAAVDRSRIRAVHVWILGVTSKLDKNHTDNNTYVVGRKVIRTSDRFHRRLLVSTVRCRNLGL